MICQDCGMEVVGDDLDVCPYCGGALEEPDGEDTPG